MKRIPLSQGKFAIVDDEDYQEMSKHQWILSNKGYAIRKKSWDGQRKTVGLHRELVQAPDGFEIDHINGDPLDNRKQNLRVCTRQDNCYNSGKRKDNTSGYKGVSWHVREKKWRAQIKQNKKRFYLGYYSVKEEAARAYDEAAQKLHGEYARPNLKG